MCPRTLEEFYGQEEITGKGKLLYRMIKADRISSVIFYGPPGTGKTSLARIIAFATKAHFEKLNAVTAGVADIKRIASDTQNSLINPQGKTVLFVDEIHRFNKSQQDALLPYVENGSIVLIGATTENPFFEVNKALISRSSVFMLKPLTEKHVRKIIDMALVDRERGLGYLNIVMTEEAKQHLANICNGDARVALNAIELAIMTSEPNSEGEIDINLAYRKSVVAPSIKKEKVAPRATKQSKIECEEFIQPENTIVEPYDIESFEQYCTEFICLLSRFNKGKEIIMGFSNDEMARYKNSFNKVTKSIRKAKTIFFGEDKKEE
jgi:replication-associated recombination protein RarA